MKVTKAQAINLGTTAFSLGCMFWSGWLWKSGAEKNARIKKANELLEHAKQLMVALDTIEVNPSDKTRVEECYKDLIAIANSVQGVKNSKELNNAIDRMHTKFGELQFVFGLATMS